MTNKSSSKQHGLHDAEGNRPKSKLYKRANKAKARVRKAAAIEELQEMLRSK